jgi:membrane-bound lytic murein transglycosylase A
MRRLPGGLVAAALTLLLAACAGGPRGPAAPPPPPAPAPQPPQAVPGSVPLSALPGWGQEDYRAALAAYVASCGMTARPAPVVCADARALGPVSPAAARAFLEARFVAVEARKPDGSAGLLTAYFAPEYAARRTPDAAFSAPVLARPADLRRGEPYADRAAIQAAPPSPALAWMRPEDLFFMQIQGSGYLTFEDGSRARAAYAADNGRTFVGIARPMAEQGLLPANGTSGDAIRAWLAAHRGAEADAVMALNPRYVFFALEPDDGGDPKGAAGIPLTARRSIAVDPAHWAYNEPVWVEAAGEGLPGARASYRGLVMALDTGGAIRGPVRADLYLGRGEAAGREAGAVRHPLRLWRLLPRP